MLEVLSLLSPVSVPLDGIWGRRVLDWGEHGVEGGLRRKTAGVAGVTGVAEVQKARPDPQV